MKFAMFVLLCCVVAFAAAAPQFLAYPGFGGWAGYAAPLTTRTVVAGPTVVNGAWGSRYVAPGYIGTGAAFL